MQIKKIIPYLLLTATLSLPLNSHSQPPDGGGDPAPFDGGLSLLIAAGAAYGVKKYRNSRKKPFDSAQPLDSAQDEQ